MVRALTEVEAQRSAFLSFSSLLGERTFKDWDNKEVREHQRDLVGEFVEQFPIFVRSHLADVVLDGLART